MGRSYEIFTNKNYLHVCLSIVCTPTGSLQAISQPPTTLDSTHITPSLLPTSPDPQRPAPPMAYSQYPQTNERLATEDMSKLSIVGPGGAIIPHPASTTVNQSGDTTTKIQCSYTQFHFCNARAATLFVLHIAVSCSAYNNVIIFPINKLLILLVQVLRATSLLRTWPQVSQIRALTLIRGVV